MLVGVLYHELSRVLGEVKARETTVIFLSEVANAVQRSWYIPEQGVPRTFQAFHHEHEHQMKNGLIRHNEHDEPVQDSDSYSFHITKCMFYETFKDMGVPWLTETFCKSDEIVFNEYSETMKFHRGESDKNTIARGGDKCVFIFENRDFK